MGAEMAACREPPGAKLVAGVWLRETEESFARALTAPCKKYKRPIIDGKAALGYHKIEAVLRLCPPERRRVVVDVGAHVGLWSMWLVKFFEHVHAFEPVPELAAILPWNMPSENYTLHPVALGDREATVAMIVVHRATGRSYIASHGYPVNPTREDEFDDIKTPISQIPLRSLDGYGIENLDFLKIDVEGFEPFVLAGGKETILKWKPLIVIEQIGNEARYSNQQDVARETLEQWGARQLRVIKGDYFMGWT